jgi:hypothetical protein
MGHWLQQSKNVSQITYGQRVLLTSIGPSEGMMMQGLQVLLGVVVLAVVIAGYGGCVEAIDIRLHSGTPLEERGREQLHRLLQMWSCQRGKEVRLDVMARLQGRSSEGRIDETDPHACRLGSRALWVCMESI